MASARWFCMLYLTHRLGFTPRHPIWRCRQGYDALRDLGAPQYWWSGTSPNLGWFGLDDALGFGEALRRLSREGAPRPLGPGHTLVELHSDALALRHAPYPEADELAELSMAGEINWQFSVDHSVTVSPGHPATLPACSPPPLPAPCRDPESLALEWERAATETPSEALPADRDSLELRCMEWSAVLCAGSAGGFAPENRLWHSWLEYYAFCDPEHPRSWYDIPPTRIGEFSGAESRRFGEVLATNPEGLIEGARAREAVKAQTGAVRCGRLRSGP